MENFFEETVFLIHAGLTGILYLAYRECRNVFTNLQNIKTYEVGNRLLTALDDSSSGTLDFAAISGKVTAISDPVLSSQGSPAVIKLLYSVGYFRNRILTTSWGASENLLYSTSSFVPFGLRNPGMSSKNLMAIIDDPTNAEFASVLTTVGTNFVESDNTSFVTFLMNTIAGKQRLGTETTEKILPVGKVLTVIGKVSKFPDGSTHISQPQDSNGKLPFIITALSLDDIRSSYKTQLKSYGFALILVGSIAGFFAAKILCKLIFSFCVQRIRRDVVKMRNPNGIAGLHDSQICITCLANPREVLFMPCGHICTCVDCWAKLVDFRCPVCRRYIVYGFPAYIP